MVSREEATETIFYSFDFPLLTESGLIQINDSQINLIFPEKPTVHVNDSIRVEKNIDVFVDNNLRFSLNWIPMHTWSDYLRVRDMFEKCLQSYSYLTGNNYFTPHTFLWNPAKNYESLTTNFMKANSFSINCFEHGHDTCIQLQLLNKEKCEKYLPLHFQLCIGKNIVFCTQRDLDYVTHTEHVHFIVQFILYKILNF